MAESAAQSAPESRDVPRESAAPQSAQIDSNQYQTGDNLRANNATDNTRDLGFANTSIDGATSNDSKYSPASAMAGQDKSKTDGQAPRGDEQTPKAGEQAPKVEDQAAKAQEQAPKAEDKAPKAEEDADTQTTRGVVEPHTEKGPDPVLEPHKEQLPDAKTKNTENGGNETVSYDDRTNSYTRVERDKDNKISSITTNDRNYEKQVTTNYSPDGKPTSQVCPDGTATYDENGNVTSDTRQNPGDRPTPQPLQTTQNPDGTTTYDAPNSDGTHQSFTFNQDKSLASTVQKTADGTTTENDFYPNGSIKEQHASNPSRFNDANEINKTWDQNGTLRSSETKNHQGWDRAEYDQNRRLTSESGGSYDGQHNYHTTYSPNGDITSDSRQGDHVTHKEYKNDGSSTTTDTNNKTQEVHYAEFKPGEGTTHITMTPDSYKRRAYDMNLNERKDMAVDYNHKR